MPKPNDLSTEGTKLPRGRNPSAPQVRTLLNQYEIKFEVRPNMAATWMIHASMQRCWPSSAWIMTSKIATYDGLCLAGAISTQDAVWTRPAPAIFGLTTATWWQKRHSSTHLTSTRVKQYRFQRRLERWLSLDSSSFFTSRGVHSTKYPTICIHPNELSQILSLDKSGPLLLACSACRKCT